MSGLAILVWEQWRAARMGFVLIGGFLGVYALLWLVSEPMILYLFSGNENVAIGAAHLAVFGVVARTCLSESRRHVTAGFPRRVF